MREAKEIARLALIRTDGEPARDGEVEAVEAVPSDAVTEPVTSSKVEVDEELFDATGAGGGPDIGEIIDGDRLVDVRQLGHVA